MFSLGAAACYLLGTLQAEHCSMHLACTCLIDATKSQLCPGYLEAGCDGTTAKGLHGECAPTLAYLHTPTHVRTIVRGALSDSVFMCVFMCVCVCACVCVCVCVRGCACWIGFSVVYTGKMVEVKSATMATM